MRRLRRNALALTWTLLLLAACVTAGQRAIPESEVSWNFDQNFENGAISVRRMPTATPYPLTTGNISLGSSFDPYLTPDTVVSWELRNPPGPAHMTINHRDVIITMYGPGDYVLHASWLYTPTATTYRFPFTVTVQ